MESSAQGKPPLLWVDTQVPGIIFTGVTAQQERKSALSKEIYWPKYIYAFSRSTP